MIEQKDEMHMLNYTFVRACELLAACRWMHAHTVLFNGAIGKQRPAYQGCQSVSAQRLAYINNANESAEDHLRLLESLLGHNMTREMMQQGQCPSLTCFCCFAGGCKAAAVSRAARRRYRRTVAPILLFIPDSARFHVSIGLSGL